MGTMIQLTAADGHKFSAYRAEPKGKPKGALVVVMEIFGVNSHIKKVTDEYAADGYLAIAPAMFDRVQPGLDIGYTPADIEVGRGIMQKMKLDDALKDVQAAMKNVESAGKIGIVGYCWGGTVSWRAAAATKGLACSVPYYGGGMPNFEDENPKVPTMCNFGELDQSPTPAQAKELLAKHPEVQGHFYAGAGHGFNCDQRGSYNAEASKLARERTLAFFRKHIG
jgi:carboxymethylenebutenolidase